MVCGILDGAPGSAGPVMDLLISNQCKKKDLKENEKNKTRQKILHIEYQLYLFLIGKIYSLNCVVYYVCFNMTNGIGSQAIYFEDLQNLQENR